MTNVLSVFRNFREEKKLKFRRDDFVIFLVITYFGEKKQKVIAHISSTNELTVAKLQPRIIDKIKSCVMYSKIVKYTFTRGVIGNVRFVPKGVG